MAQRAAQDAQIPGVSGRRGDKEPKAGYNVVGHNWVQLVGENDERCTGNGVLVMAVICS